MDRDRGRPGDGIKPSRHPERPAAEVSLASLLRMSYAIVRHEALAALQLTGFTDLADGHLTVLSALRDGPRRPIELARRCRMSRQALGYLVKGMEGAGYVERVPGEKTPRRLVQLTAKGAEASGVSAAAYRELEAAWRREEGDKEIDHLHAILAHLVDHFG
jgi:DNA-binding MarR family transcriptional regulator